MNQRGNVNSELLLENLLCVVDDVSKGVDDPVSSQFIPLYYTTNIRVFHEHAVLGLVAKDGQDKERCSVKDGLLKAEESAMGDEHLYVVMSCGMKGVSGNCAWPPSYKSKTQEHKNTRK